MSNRQHTAANLEAALTLARAGIPIFPAEVFRKGTRWAKRPLVKGWRDAATTDERQIRKWWSRFPRAVPGIELGQAALVVIDADRHIEGVDGVTALAALAERHGALPEHPICSTAGDGQHHYFDLSDSSPLGNGRGALPAGIDVRGVGGWAVGPGAVRPDGLRWQMAPGSPSVADAPPLPEWLAASIRATPQRPSPDRPLPNQNGAAPPSSGREAVYARQALRGAAADLRGKLEGQRNETLNASAYHLGRMVARGWIDKIDVADELTEAALATGLDPDEAQRTLVSGLTAGMQQPAEDLQDRPRVHVNGHAPDQSAATWPDPVPLPTRLLPVEPFDYGMLPEAVRGWVEDVSERMQCPPDYVAVTMMAALASLIGRKLGVRPKLEDDWTVVANVWALLIGPPGIMKSPAQNDALRFLKALAAKAREAYALAKAEYDIKVAVAKAKGKQAEKEAAKALAEDRNASIDDLLKPQNPDGEPPKLTRYMTTNATYEALAVLMQENPNGLLVDRDEMLSLLDRLDEEGHADERGFYLSGSNGDTPYTVDRIGRGLDLHCEAVCLSMVGGTQPARISQYLAGVRRGGGRSNDGLIQRFGLMVWPDISPTWRNVDRKPSAAARKAASDAFETIGKLDWRAARGMRDRVGGDEHGLPYVRLSQEAHEPFLAWRTQLEHRLRQNELDPMLIEHLAKYRKLVPGIALTIHLTEGGTGDVTAAAVEKALKWAAYLETHAARTYASLSIASADAARAIIAKISSGHLKQQFGSREIVRAQWSMLRDRETIHAALQLLVDHEWLSMAKVETSGRTATVYSINPKAVTRANMSQGPT